MRSEMKIVRIEAVAGILPKKQTTYSGTGYVYPVIYTLEDGSKHSSTEQSRLLRDAKIKQAQLPREVSNMRAILEDGKIVMTSSSYIIGGSGLQELGE